MTDQTTYFRKRLDEEHARANAAERAEVRQAHLGLAALYIAKLREAEEPLLRMVG